MDSERDALEIKAGSTVTSSDAAGIRAFRASLKKNQHLVRGVVLHAGQSRPLDTDPLALPLGLEGGRRMKPVTGGQDLPISQSGSLR